MDALLLITYLALLVVAAIGARDLGRAVLGIALGLSLAGVGINLALDLGLRFDSLALQVALLVTLAVTAGLLWGGRPARDGQGRRALIGIGVPVLAAFALIGLVTVLWTEPGPAFLQPVAFLIGHGTAEDNAKWLDFAAQFASGSAIEQGVPVGGPLQLVMTFWGTAMSAVSAMALGGLNQVAVAANAVVFAQLSFAALAPLALAPLVRMRVKNTGGQRRRIPIAGLWVGALVLAAATLVVTGYGHLTFQYSMFAAGLWSAVFLATREHRPRLLASLVVAATMTVWLPLNVLAVLVLVGVAWVVVRDARRHGRGAFDPVVAAAWVMVAVGTWEPIRSSVSFVLSSGGAVASGDAGGAVRGIAAAVTSSGPVRALLDGVGLFSSPGGTEPIGAVLATVTAAAALACAWSVARSPGDRRHGGPSALLPVATLAGYAAAITALDAWVTGSAPNYGSLKFGFLAVIVTLSTAVPVAIATLGPDEPRMRDGMTALRWGAALAVVLLLMIDTLLPRSIAAARPEQWSPGLPYANPRSWWWPAEVNGTGSQPLASNPIGCVYLPNGAKAPSAILESQLSGGDRVYACTRILSGLGGVDGPAQPLVDWLRREWLTNTPAWDNVHGYLAGMPEDVRRRPIILLDDLSNVIGIETMDSLLQRFPPQPAQ